MLGCFNTLTRMWVFSQTFFSSLLFLRVIYRERGHEVGHRLWALLVLVISDVFKNSS